MSSSQYSSPKIWGPHFWYMLRCMAHNYPLKPTEDDSKHIKIFFSELQYLLPCDLCKYTFRQHFAKYPIDKHLSSRNSLIEWVEIIYQETGKVIQNARIKIMETPEEVDEVKPIKMSYKTRVDPIEEQLNAMRRNVMSKDVSNKAIPVPTLAQINEAKKQQTKDKIIKPPRALNKSNGNFDKVNNGKRNEVEMVRNIEPILFKPTVDFSIDKINAGNKIITNSLKKPTPIVPVVSSKPIIPGMNNQLISAQIIPSRQIVPMPTIVKPQIPIVATKIPVYTIPKMPQMPVYDKGLTLTRKCRKCQH